MVKTGKTPNPQNAPSSTRPLTGWGIDNSQPDVASDQPPAYSIALLEDTTSSADHQSRPSLERFVRICPHQKISFERFHQIAHLPNIHYATRLDALMKLPTAHHDRKVCHLRQCTTKPGANQGILPPVMYASLHYVLNSDIGLAAGFELSARWYFVLGHDSEEKKSKDSMKRFLANPNVWLCPHFKLSDGWIVSALFGILHPGERYDDPVEQYRAEQRGGDDALRCGDCKTEVRVSGVERTGECEECKVIATRFLGQGQSADDASWLEQCALKRNEDESLDADKDRRCCVM